ICTISARRSGRVNLRGHRGSGVIGFARPGADFGLRQSSALSPSPRCPHPLSPSPMSSPPPLHPGLAPGVRRGFVRLTRPLLSPSPMSSPPLPLPHPPTPPPPLPPAPTGDGRSAPPPPF